MDKEKLIAQLQNMLDSRAMYNEEDLVDFSYLFSLAEMRMILAALRVHPEEGWNTALDKALLACEAEQAKYSQQGLEAKAVRGALEYAMTAIRALKKPLPQKDKS